MCELRRPRGVVVVTTARRGQKAIVQRQPVSATRLVLCANNYQDTITHLTAERDRAIALALECRAHLMRKQTGVVDPGVGPPARHLRARLDDVTEVVLQIDRMIPPLRTIHQAMMRLEAGVS